MNSRVSVKAIRQAENSSDYFQQLFILCERVSPVLQGKCCAAQPGMILPNTNNQQAVAQLYQELKQHYPTAGAAYWLGRSWSLLTWQPIYIAFTAIYQLRSLPNLSTIAQRHSPALIAGFSLSSDDVQEGDYPTLIAQAGQQLLTLFSYYSADLSQLRPLREPWLQRYLSDTVLLQLQALHQRLPGCELTFIREQAALWLAALELPDTALSSIQLTADQQQLFIQRQSCCLAFKATECNLCAGCPCARSKTKQKEAQ
ncbi:siderophore ferric iron reductase [Sinobacterium caligoides]|uniref:Siderophore ferric iron reductase n=1 Tax=Sinobacterium caligoides TaxID=933926 RepID=A0A3N2DK51_9GAMM|nr:siderophore ferric iron reductase [Sinobacterium caligoides]ROS00148.1 siderophore ferric iron reductase [Sinobacterium caligoides]